MKIRRIFIAIFFVGAGAGVLAQGHSLHSWQKLTEQKGMNGQVVCTWVCKSGLDGAHHQTTSGYGICSRPF